MIRRFPLPSSSHADETPALHLRRKAALLLYAPLVCARNTHIFPVLCHRTTGHLDALRLQDAGNLFVCQRARWIFFVDQLLDAPFEDEQRSIAALGTLHAFGEEITQLEDSLRRVGVFARNRSADSRWMHADLLRDFLDHH